MPFINQFDQINEGYLQNAPIKVRMAGFESDSLTLQRNGWQLSVESMRDFARDSVQQRVAFKHEGIKQYALGIFNWDAMHLMRGANHSLEYLKNIGIDITYIAPMIQCQVVPIGVPVGQSLRFDPVGGLPEWANSRVNLEDIAIFKPIKLDNAIDIVINQKDEEELMKIILAKQDIKQAEIRQRRKREAFRSGHYNQTIDTNSIRDKQNEDIKCNIVCVA